MDPITLAIVRNDLRRVQAAIGWKSGLGAPILAWDTGLTPTPNLHGAATDSGHVWQVSAGSDWRRTSGYIESFGGLDNRAAVVDVGTPDVIIAVDIADSHQTPDRDSGIVFRYIDDTTFLIATVQASRSVLRSQVRVEKVEQGNRTILATAILPELLQRRGSGRLTVRVVAHRITVLIDEHPVLGYELVGDDGTTYATSTKHGIGARLQVSAGINRWRNFAVWNAREFGGDYA